MRSNSISMSRGNEPLSSYSVIALHRPSPDGRQRILRLALIVAILILATVFFASLLSSTDQNTYQYADGTNVTQIAFDSPVSVDYGTFFLDTGSSSYMGHTLATPDVYANVCHPNLILNSTLDFVYSSYSGDLVKSILNLPLQVINVTQQSINGTLMNCTTVNTNFAAAGALYPGFVNALVTTGNSRYLIQNTNPDGSIGTNVTPLFNGTMNATLVVDSPPKSYWFSVSQIQDGNGNLITSNRSQLVASLISADNQTLMEKIMRPGEILNYSGTLVGGERFIVNGLTLIKIKLYEPCDPITSSGYYVVNKSLFNLTQTCIIIVNTSDVKLNFGGELIGGDANLSYNDSACPLLVTNSNTITLESVQTQQFHNGVCIDNSTVAVFGSDLSYNNRGFQINESSSVRAVDAAFTNSDLEFNVSNGSILNLNYGTLSTANLTGTFHDVTVNGVTDLPPLPTVTGFSVIDQYVQVSRNDPDSWARIGFNYPANLPHSTVDDVMYIYEFNGSFVNQTVIDDNVTNASHQVIGWTGGSWAIASTILDRTNRFIYVPNATHFSVFAPVAIVVMHNQTPGGNNGGGGGGGGGGGAMGAPQITNIITVPPTDVLLRLTIPPELRIKQGDIGEMNFTIENIGSTLARNVSIRAEVPRGWNASDAWYSAIAPGQIFDDSLYMSVYEKQKPGDYFIPIDVYLNDKLVLGRILHVIVLPRGNLTRLVITKYDKSITMRPNWQTPVKFTAKNTGDGALNDVQIQLSENTCIDQVVGSSKFDVGEEKQVTYQFISADVGDCYVTVKFMEGDTVAGFVNVYIHVKRLSWIEYALIAVALAVIIFFLVKIIQKRRREREPPLPPDLARALKWVRGY